MRGLIRTGGGGTSPTTEVSSGDKAALVTPVDIPMDAKGNYPETWYLESTDTGAAAGAVYTSSDVSMYNRFTLEVSGLTATSADVYASVDGTNFSAIKVWDASTGAVFATTAITANGMYYLDAKYKALRVDQVGAGAVVLRYSHGNI